MLYQILKLPAAIALWFYCKKVRINKKEFLNLKGPLILAANHPNSFLDAIILCTLFKQPIYSLARGDVFHKYKMAAPFLRSLNIYPVYRTREGVEYLDLNYATFEACQEIFKKNGIVLIFSEGLCENEWHLRPLKKGTARLVMNAWNENIPLKILPVGLNYSSFKYFGKHLILNLGNLLTRDNTDIDGSDGKRLLNFNNKLNAELQQLVYEINEHDMEKIKTTFALPVQPIKQTLLLLPGLLGYIICAPVYFLLKNFANKKFAHSGHYDSFMVAPLFFLFPIYLFIIFLVLIIATSVKWAAIVIIIAIFCAWSTLQIRTVIKPVTGNNIPA